MGIPETYRISGGELGLLQPVCGLVSEICMQGQEDSEAVVEREEVIDG